jgi:crossover junction endodeoxyribonuclease RuvC
LAIILGIDPGATGALAFLDTKTNKLEIIDMPACRASNGKARVDASQLVYLLSGRRRFHATIEDVHAMPGNGSGSMFSFGRSLGVAEGTAHSFAASVDYVTPQAWTRALDIKPGATKAHHRQRAAEIFPDNASQFGRAKDDGRADAALIAAYAARSGDYA